MFAFVQIGFYFLIRTMVPYDPVWYHSSLARPASRRRLLGSLMLGGGLSGIVCLFAIGGLLGVIPVTLSRLPVIGALPEPLYIAVSVTPLLIPGFAFRTEEQRIIARDEEFPSFIRALGTSESAKRSTTSDVLATLRSKDFGPLSNEVDDLYKRLAMRLDSDLAWRCFTAESRSYLIQKFSEMYLVGRQMGGRPRRLGELISRNMIEVNRLREQRQQATVTLIGLLYGITAAASFAFFIGLEIVAILSGMSLDLSAASQLGVGQLIHTEIYDIDLIRYLLLLVIVFNAALSALMIRTVDGGVKANSLDHFVLLTWSGV